MKKAVLGVLIIILIGSLAKGAEAKTSLSKPVCYSRSKNSFRCHAHIMTDQGNRPDTSGVPDGYGPAQFLKAYKLSGKTSSNKTIAIVDAYDDPNILNDLKIYSKTFGISLLKDCPISSGTTSSPCFEKIDQRGGKSYPSKDAGWALETSMDVEIAHGICQNCNLLLVEADSESFDDLLAAFDEAVSRGAKVISNSYGGKEFSGETSFDNHFNHPGIAMTFSSGDSGYGVEYPAASKYVTAVGGTSLSMLGNEYVGEVAWDGAGSGCSKYEGKPSWQNDKCSKRAVADVSADADPATGAAVFDSFSYGGKSGWFKVGGTSLSSPIIAGVYALSKVPSENLENSLPYLKGKKSNLHDVLDGKNGKCRTALCKAGLGYDGPTGLGTPKGLGAF